MQRGLFLIMAVLLLALLSASPAYACPSTWRAERWAEKHKEVSFAVYCRGKIKGVRSYRRSNSASTGKALLLVAHLRAHRPVAPVKAQLRAMITSSDNQAASLIYAGLGDRPLRQALRRMEMERTRLCSCWASIKWSPRDYSKLFMSLPDALPRKRRGFAMGLFKGVIPSQRWGIPRAAKPYGWKSYLKGGWRPESGGWIVLQGAQLRKKEEKIGLAVFTRRQPSLEAGAQKIERLTRLLLRPVKRKPSPVIKTGFTWAGQTGLAVPTERGGFPGQGKQVKPLF